MGDLLKKIFHREEKEKPSPRQQCPVNFAIEDKINIHKDEVIPKLWKGVVHSVSESAFSVDIPDLMGEFPFPFKEESVITVSVVKGDKTARFSTRLMKIAWKSKPPILILEFPEEIIWEDTKAREYIRIKTDLPAKLKVEGKSDSGWQMVRIVDFSLTGLLLLSPVPFVQGDKLRVNFMQFQFPLEPLAVVMWSTKDEENKDRASYNIGLRFEEMNIHDQQMLSGFAYKLQRKSG